MEPNSAYLEESRALFEQASQALLEKDFEKVLKLCGQMMERGFSGGWELKAQVQSQQGDKKAALLTLRDLLGLNLSQCIAKEQESEAHAHHVRLLVRAGLSEAVDYMAEQNWLLAAKDVLAYAADESLKLGLKEQALKFAVSAALCEHEDDSALWYIREARGLRSANTVMRRFTISGYNRVTQKMTSVHYHVASDDLEQALNFVKELEPDMPALEITEMTNEENSEELPWGVYWRSPWIC